MEKNTGNLYVPSVDASLCTSCLGFISVVKGSCSKVVMEQYVLRKNLKAGVTSYWCSGSLEHP